MLMVNSSQAELQHGTIKVVTSGATVSIKELFILSLFFSLFFYAIFSFLKIWNNTLGEIGTFYFYEEPEEVESPPESRKHSIAARRQSTRKQSCKPRQFSHVVGVSGLVINIEFYLLFYCRLFVQCRDSNILLISICKKTWRNKGCLKNILVMTVSFKLKWLSLKINWTQL